MKIRLSETIKDQIPEAEETADELTLKRVRAMALSKAGFKKQPKRSIKRRTLITLVAALLSVLVFATSLATTDLGVKLADMFKEYGGMKGTLDAIGLYGSAIGCEATDQDITVRVEAAYADGGTNILALSFEDALGRFIPGMTFSPGVEGSRLKITSASWYYPTQTADGAMHALYTFGAESPAGGKNITLKIDSIVPGRTDFQDHSIGLTLGEALRETPLAVPSIPEAQFTDVHFEEGGLIIAIKYPDDIGLYFSGITLKLEDGSILANEEHSTVYPSDWLEGNVEYFGFSGLKDEDALRSAQLLLSYTREHEPIEGDWTLSFRMPRNSNNGISTPLDNSFRLSEVDYHLTNATLYPACVTIDFVSYEGERRMNYEEPEGTHYLFYDDDYSFPEFELADENGVISSGSHHIWITDSIDDDDVVHRRALISCVTEQYDSITLIAKNDMNGEALMSIKLK